MDNVFRVSMIGAYKVEAWQIEGYFIRAECPVAVAVAVVLCSIVFSLYTEPRAKYAPCVGL